MCTLPFLLEALNICLMSSYEWKLNMVGIVEAHSKPRNFIGVNWIVILRESFSWLLMSGKMEVFELFAFLHLPLKMLKGRTWWRSGKIASFYLWNRYHGVVLNFCYLSQHSCESENPSLQGRMSMYEWCQ